MTASDLVPSDELLIETLAEAVFIAVGKRGVPPRPGQLKLALDIFHSMVSRTQPTTAVDTSSGQVAGKAGTGVGKSLGYLVPSMMMSALKGHRVVISTESLGLQAQIVDKDAVMAAEAVSTTCGKRPSVALLKGWNNYVCAQQAMSSAAAVLGMPSVPGSSQASTVLEALEPHAEKAEGGFEPKVMIEEEEYAATDLLPLLQWAVRSMVPPSSLADDPHPSDRHSYPGSADQKLWDTVSTTPDACPGAKKCPFGPVCAPATARMKAAHADVVVTNHSMLAVQAATGAPVILGNRRLGVFDHIIVDEAHTLPGQVRNQGAKAVDAWRVFRAIKTFERFVIVEAGKNQALVDSGYALAESLDRHLSGKVVQARQATTFGSAVVEIEPEDDPLETIGDEIAQWTSSLNAAMPTEAGAAYENERMKIRKARNSIANLAADIAFIREAGSDRARWFEDGKRDGMYVGASVKASPVDVSTLLKTRVWTADVTSLMEPGDVTNPEAESRPSDTWGVPEYRWVSPPEGINPPRYGLTSICVSATLNNAFTLDAGLNVRRSEYESPFGDSYEASALFVPRAETDLDYAQLTRDPNARRLSFDTKRHPMWATRYISELVKANGGSALVLAATSASGQSYADSLRVALAIAGMSHINVYSQWDGPPTRLLLQQWKEDKSSVMVGTRSLMTGVDAPGQTCSLVIIDRVPRSAGNPVDDARVASIMEQTGLDKWSADRQVYVSDSNLLLDQAAGRLIRSISDRGMVCVLDPRLLKSGRLSYPEPTRELLMEPLMKFGNKFADLEPALAWLAALREEREAVAA